MLEKIVQSRRFWGITGKIGQQMKLKEGRGLPFYLMWKWANNDKWQLCWPWRWKEFCTSQSDQPSSWQYLSLQSYSTIHKIYEYFNLLTFYNSDAKYSYILQIHLWMIKYLVKLELSPCWCCSLKRNRWKRVEIIITSLQQIKQTIRQMLLQLQYWFS